MALKIDAHQHFWRYSAQTHAWLDDSMPALKRDFLPSDLEPLLRAAGVDGCIAVQAQQDVAETEWLLALADEHDFIRGVVGWVDLCVGDVHAKLAAVAHPKLRGVRHVVQDEPDGFMARADFRRGVAALAEVDLAYDILVYSRQLPAAIELVRAFPDQRFVVDHIAKPDIRSGEIERWAADIAELARSGDVYCKLSGMVTEADWRNWRADDFTPYLDAVMRAFGPSRLMIGSDWPVCTLAGAYGDVMGIVERYVERMPADQREGILGANAARFYRLTAA